MSRYKSYRDHRRRGSDDNFGPGEYEERPSFDRPSYQSPQRAAPQSSEPVEAVVKWFNPEKGFGFVSVVGGSEAFLHIRPLEAAGHSTVPEGAKVKVRIGQGQKGMQVTEVLEVDASTAQPSGERRGPPRQPSHRPSGPRGAPSGPTQEGVGSVKWYNPDKGFGFIAQDGGGKDVFIHASVLERSGVTRLAEGQRVKMTIGEGQKGLEVRSIEPLD